MDVILGPILTNRSKARTAASGNRIGRPPLVSGGVFPRPDDRPSPRSPSSICCCAPAWPYVRGCRVKPHCGPSPCGRQKSAASKIGWAVLEVGKDADFIILSDDPLSLAAKVDITVINGRIVHERSAVR